MAKKKDCSESETQIPQTKRKGHHAVNLVLKEAMIDELMVPIVRWLNGFDSAFTIACCQGELGNGKMIDNTQKPYVFFLCFDNKDLIDILHALDFAGGCSVETQVKWDEHRAALAYIVHWPHRESLLETIKYLPC